MLAISGRKSTVAQALEQLVADFDGVKDFDVDDDPKRADRYVFFDGSLSGKKLEELPDLGSHQWRVNFAIVAERIDHLLTHNPRARIVVLGSMSAIRGSYDTAYMGAKAALHAYVQTRPLAPEQQLVAIAPWIIADTVMTQRRTDVERLEEYRRKHPKGRFITAAEVAALIWHVLYVDQGYLTNVVIPLHGGMGIGR